MRHRGPPEEVAVGEQERGKARVDQSALAAEFEPHRGRLTGLAYRILGTLADAEDAVQDAWLRLSGTDRNAIRDLGAWLTTVTSRLCLDRLRAARRAREVYVGEWLPEPVVVGRDQPRGPAELFEVDESVRLAMLVVLERLSPEQRVAFVLHDAFAVPFEEIADVLGSSPAAVRQLASRGRRHVREARVPALVPVAEQEATLGALSAAVLDGDLDALVGLLAPGVVAHSDGGGRVKAALRPVVGAGKVARLLLGLRASLVDVRFEPEAVLVNGEAGVLVRVGAPVEELTLVVPHVGSDGRIHRIDMIRNPDKLTRV